MRADDSVKTISDLKGKKVGVSTVGSVTGWIVGEVSRQQGWGYDGIAPIAIGDDAMRAAALKTKAVDGAIVNLAVALNFVQRGDGQILLRFGDLLKDFHVHVIFATDKAIAGRPDALRKFLAGWFETIAFMRKDKAKTVEIAKEVMGTDAADRGRIYDEMMPMFNDDGQLQAEGARRAEPVLVDMKLCRPNPKCAR